MIKYMNILLIIIIVLVVLSACAVAGYFIFNSSDDSSEKTTDSTSEESTTTNNTTNSTTNNTSTNSTTQNVTNTNEKDSNVTTTQNNGSVSIPLTVIQSDVTSSAEDGHVFNYIFDNNTSTYWKPAKQSEPEIVRFRLTTVGGAIYKPTSVKIAVMGDTTHDPKNFILSVSDKSKVFNIKTGTDEIQTFEITDIPESNQFDVELGVLENESPVIRLFSLEGTKK